MQNKQLGTLYVVATPIGNLQDISLRAIEVLRAVDKIIAEDTRHILPLLNHFNIQKTTISFNHFNERERLEGVLQDLSSGFAIALVSDAGTPLISDPGFLLVKAAKDAGINVVPVPGACAAIAALSVAGLPTDKFVFEGFLPAKEEARFKRLEVLSKEMRTLIFYEAPHRLIASLHAMQMVFGASRLAVVAREMTKIYESILYLPLGELHDYYVKHAEKNKGEIVIVVKGAAEIPIENQEAEQVLNILLKHLPLKQAVLIASELVKQKKNELYELALNLQHLK